MTIMNGKALLDVRDLTVEFATRDGVVRAVEKVDFSVAKGETVGIVGESGSGKSVTSYAVMRILDRAGRVAGGSIIYGGIDIPSVREREMADLRGREISMIFQNPRAALNPVRTVGRQIEDALIRHSLATRLDATDKAIEMLRSVRIPRPEERHGAYPFELSGGQCQRVVIAIALACRPRLLIADEPTTGLDVTTQKAVMDLIAELTRERGMSTILITHDLGLAAAYCDRLVVMEKGAVVESAASAELFAHPRHPYTRRLLRATPRVGSTLRGLLSDDPIAAEPIRATPMAPRIEPLLDVRDLTKEFPARGGVPAFRAVDRLSFSIAKGESLGLVGESGCGKSTTSAMVMRLMDPTSGTVTLDGADLTAIPAKRFAKSRHRAELQMVFQDPTESLNPRWSAADSIADPLRRLGGVTRRDEARAKVEELAGLVGLPVGLLDRFPHQLSGGQKARVGIARAIALRPSLVILDEPTAALDVSVQAVVLNLLADLKAELGMSYLFITHDLTVVRMMCDTIMVMRAGKVVERGPAEAVTGDPKDEYTRQLLAAIPHPPDAPHMEMGSAT